MENVYTREAELCLTIFCVLYKTDRVVVEYHQLFTPAQLDWQ